MPDEETSVVVNCPKCRRTHWFDQRCPACHPGPKQEQLAPEVKPLPIPSAKKNLRGGTSR